MTPQEIMKKLQAPFPPDEIEWRTQSCGISKEGNPWAIVLGYIQARAIQRRLDEVFEWDGWTEEYRVSNTDIICRVGVRTSDAWIYKENGASNTDIEAFKGGISGAFKRAAASGFGIGRYLYNLKESFAECSLTKQTGWHKAKTKDKKEIYWKEPQLPSWALPEGYNKLPGGKTGSGNTNTGTTQYKPPAGQKNAPERGTVFTGPDAKFEADFGKEVEDALFGLICNHPGCGKTVDETVRNWCKNKGYDATYCKTCQAKHSPKQTA